MSGRSLQMTGTDSSAKSVRIPPLPGKQSGLSHVDIDGDAYKAGVNAAAAEFRAEMAEQEARHEAFMQNVGDMLSEMDHRYRQECLSLIERLFAAVAPTLAKKSSMDDILRMIDERALRKNADLTLRVHPALIEHLPGDTQQILSQSPKITLKPDETCAPASIDARWDNGGMFHDPDNLIEDVLSVLKQETTSQKETDHE